MIARVFLGRMCVPGSRACPQIMRDCTRGAVATSAQTQLRYHERLGHFSLAASATLYSLCDTCKYRRSCKEETSEEASAIARLQFGFGYLPLI